MTKQLAQTITNPVVDPSVGTGEGAPALAITMANLYRTVVMLGALALLLYLAWGGLNWVMSGGDPENVKQAKERITQAIVGMAILVAVVAIATLLSETLSFDLLNPTIPEP